MASSSCSPQSQRIEPMVSPVKHSEWRRMSGGGIVVGVGMSECECSCDCGDSCGGEEACCEVDDKRPTYAPLVIRSISVSFSFHTASRDRLRIAGA